MIPTGIACRYQATFAREWKGICAIGATLAFNISLNNTSMLDMTLSLNQIIRWAHTSKFSTYFISTLNFPSDLNVLSEQIRVLPMGTPRGHRNRTEKRRDCLSSTGLSSSSEMVAESVGVLPRACINVD